MRLPGLPAARGFRFAALALAVGAAIGGWPTAAAAQATDVITRGAVIGAAPVADLAAVLRGADAADRYTDRTVILEGAVRAVCQEKGCWMELAPAGADRGIRVTFKDYAFFVPRDSTGYAARIEGVFERNVFSKADADHLIGEGVRLTRNADGTATEVSFVAQAVELRH